jgi:hypothetical protein
VFYCDDVQKQANGMRGATPTPLKYAACQQKWKPIKCRATVNAFKTDVDFDDDDRFTPRTKYCACHAQMSTDDNHENDSDNKKWTTLQVICVLPA